MKRQEQLHLHHFLQALFCEHYPIMWFVPTHSTYAHDVVFSHSNTSFQAQLFQKISKNGQCPDSSDNSPWNFCLRAKSGN